MPGTLGSDYVYFVEGLRRLGHVVHHYDHVSASVDKAAMNDFFLSIVEHGRYDLVWIATESDEFDGAALDQARQRCPIVAWNADDNVRWVDYTSRWCKHYTWVITTYPEIYKQYKGIQPNLLLSQWACTGTNEGIDVAKDLDFSFVGNLDRNRGRAIRELQKSVPMEVFGRGQLPGWRTSFRKWLARKCALHLPEGARLPRSEAEVKDIWNRSRVSFTPLDSWVPGKVQVKARVFDMGLSGTVMLCDSNEALQCYYEPGKEFVEFHDLSECASKCKYLLAHEAERRRIGEAYARRTRAEHLWSHRFAKLFGEMGLK